MFIPFSRAVVLAVLYLSVLPVTNAVPVVQDGTEVSASSGLPAGDYGHVVELDARARTTKPKPRPKPKPTKTIIRKPAPTKTTIRRPVPTKTTIRRPVPTKTTIRKPVPTKTPAKPVPTRVPAKPVPTHAPAKPAPTRTPAKPAPTTKVPTPAKPTTPVKRPTAVPKPPARPTKPVTPSKPPVKAPPRPTPMPTKPPVKVPPKPTKTTSKTPTATPTKAPQCPVKKPTKGTKGPRALFEWAASLFRRNGPEFIGWHGTNSNTAQLWASMGYLANPKTSGWPWPWNSGGTSGADHELGEGVYITDAMETARGFAYNNAVMNPGTAPMLCGIFARSSTHWRNGVHKVWIPDSIIRDSSVPALHVTYEKHRTDWIGMVIPHSTGRDVARFGPLDKNRGGPPNQVVLPSALTSYVYAVCVDARTDDVPDGADMHINFKSERHPWNILDTPCSPGGR